MPVVAIGELLVDWLSTEPGGDVFNASQFHRALGGNSANVAIGLHKLGTPVRLIAKTGNDFHAEFLQRKLSNIGMSGDYIVSDPQYPTAQCYMTTSADGEHEYRNWPRPHAADMLCPAEVPDSAFDGARFLHATGISFMAEPRRDAVQRALDIARERNIIVSFDGLFPTGRAAEAHELVESALYQTQLLKLNEHELKFWAGDPTPHTVLAAAQRVFERYNPIALFITQAERGSFVMTNKGVAECAAIPVQCVCGVGAGDAYIAGVLHILYQDFFDRDLLTLSVDDWHRVGMVGNLTGALATRFIDAHSGIPTGAELTAWLEKHAR